MTFTFETLPLENKEILRQGILKRYDRDIATVSCSFTNVQIICKFYPKDILSAVLAPMCAYLKDDKPPVDRVEEVQLASKDCLTPEQSKFVEGYIKHAMG